MGIGRNEALAALGVLAALVVSAPAARAQVEAAPEADGAQATEGFEDFEPGRYKRVESSIGDIAVQEGWLTLIDGSRRGLADGICLRLDAASAGEPLDVTLELDGPAAPGETLEFLARRAQKPRTFELRLEFAGAEGALGALDLAPIVRQGAFAPASVALPEGAQTLRFVGRCEGRSPLMVDDLARRQPRRMELESVTLTHVARPAIADGEPFVAARIEQLATGTLDAIQSTTFDLRLEDEVGLARLELVGDAGTFTGEATEEGWSVVVDAPTRPGRTLFDVRAVLSPAPETGGPALQRSPRVLLAASHRPARAEGADESAPVVEVPAAASIVAAVLTPADQATCDTTSMVSVGSTNKKAGHVVCAAGLVDPSGAGVVRVFHWSPEGVRTTFDLAHGGYQLSRPSLLATRGTERVLLAAEATSSGRDRESPELLLGFWSEDGGRTFAAGEVLAIVDDDDVGHYGGCVRFTGGRGAVDGEGNWALPILRSYGHARQAAAILVSRDQGATWTVSSEVFRGAKTATIVSLGNTAILIDASFGSGAVRRETSTLNGGVWWQERLSTTRPARPAAPNGTAFVHVGLDTGW
ncbi:MAG: sialidase family protein, partial [Planctomycetota bacterium]